MHTITNICSYLSEVHLKENLCMSKLIKGPELIVQVICLYDAEHELMNLTLHLFNVGMVRFSKIASVASEFSKASFSFQPTYQNFIFDRSQVQLLI